MFVKDLEASVVTMESSVKVRAALRDMSVNSYIDKSPYKQVTCEFIVFYVVTSQHHCIVVHFLPHRVVNCSICCCQVCMSICRLSHK